MTCVKWQEGKTVSSAGKALSWECCLPRARGRSRSQNREMRRGRKHGKGGLTLVKVRDTCLLPQIVTQAATALTSSWRTDYEEAVATATARVAMEIVMCERSVSRTQTEGPRPNRIVPLLHDLCSRWLLSLQTQRFSKNVHKDERTSKSSVFCLQG